MHHILFSPHILFWTRHNVNRCQINKVRFSCSKPSRHFAMGLELHTIPNHLYTFRGNSGLMQCMLHLCSPAVAYNGGVFLEGGVGGSVGCPKFIVKSTDSQKHPALCANPPSRPRSFSISSLFFSANAVFSRSGWQGQQAPTSTTPN